MQELWLLCMTRRLNVLYKCNGYQVIERTRFCDYLCYNGDNLKNTHARVMVLVHDTSSQYASQMYKVSLKYIRSNMTEKLLTGTLNLNPNQ